MSDDAASLAAATAAPQPIRLAVRGSEGTREIELRQPFAIVGRASDCDVRIKSESVSYRHLYLQALAGGLYFVDLGSRSGVQQGGQVVTAGWLSIGDAIQLGPYSIDQAAKPGAADAASSAIAADLNPLDQMSPLAADFPRVELEFMNPSIQQPAWTVNRLLTLVGRGSLCKLRLEGKSVSTVHCSFVLTRRGLWVIDLLGKGGTRVDQKPVRCVRLQQGHVLGIGDYRIRVRQHSGGTSSSTVPDSATAGPGPGDDKPGQAAAPDSRYSTRMADAFGFESLLNVERRDELLIVAPSVEGGAFRQAQLRTASNAVRRLFDEFGIRRLLIDLEQLNYFGAEFVGVLITLARKVSDDGGLVVMCNARPELQEVLQNMNLFGLWPHFSSREEALRYLEE